MAPFWDDQPSSSDLRVTARNPTDGRITWGRGSSSCQLSADVHADGAWLPILTLRICRSDMVDQGLDPGESREEFLFWDGVVMRGGVRDTLVPGRYVVRGRAGDQGASGGLAIHLTAQPNQRMQLAGTRK